MYLEFETHLCDSHKIEISHEVRDTKEMSSVIRTSTNHVIVYINESHLVRLINYKSIDTPTRSKPTNRHKTVLPKLSFKESNGLFWLHVKVLTVIVNTGPYSPTKFSIQV